MPDSWSRAFISRGNARTTDDVEGGGVLGKGPNAFPQKTRFSTSAMAEETSRGAKRHESPCAHIFTEAEACEKAKSPHFRINLAEIEALSQTEHLRSIDHI